MSNKVQKIRVFRDSELNFCIQIHVRGLFSMHWKTVEKYKNEYKEMAIESAQLYADRINKFGDYRVAWADTAEPEAKEPQQVVIVEEPRHFKEE